MSLVKPFRRIAIVNRGESAMRLIRAVREYNAEHDAELRTIALYTRPDRHAMFVREADEAHALGSATWVDEETGEYRSRYLDREVLRQALRKTGAEAVWAGWGFVAESPDFVDLCEREGLVFLGPSGDAMRRLGNKIQAKRLAAECGILLAPWSEGEVRDLEDARVQAERIGYPVMVKAAEGSGGRGIRSVADEDELAEAFDAARSEARRLFDDDTVFLERRVDGARHVEVQFVADSHGTAWPLGVRDCTIQRRNQKIFEESPSPVLTEKEDRDLQDAALRLVGSVDYCGTGTVEFLFRPEDRGLSFLEVNPRLQVEHPVSEVRTGVDLVKLQLHVGLGGALEGDPPVPTGHAIEARINAENPEAAFAPSPGTLEVFQLRSGPGVRVDSGFDEGDVISPEFDSMIAKVVAGGRNREEALARLKRSLGEASVVIHGGTSNRGFMYDLCRHPDVLQNRTDTFWLDRLVAAGEHRSREHADLALLMAAIECYEEEQTDRRVRFLRTAHRGRPEVKANGGVEVEIHLAGQHYVLTVHRTGPKSYRVQTEGQVLDVHREPAGRYRYRVRCGGRRHRVLSMIQGLHCLVDVDGVSHRISLDHGGAVRAPSPAMVVSLSVEAGDLVEKGDRLVTLEAMKMELHVTASHAGRVRNVNVLANQQVTAQTPLMTIEPAAPVEEVQEDRERISFEGLEKAGDAEDLDWQSCQRNLEELRGLVLGYDVEAGHLRSLVSQQCPLCTGVDPADPRVLEAEDRVLEAFADICALFRRTPSSGGVDAADRHGVEESFFTYLRDLRGRAEGLPESFQSQLLRTLAHYGVDSLQRSRRLEESLYRICAAWQQLEQRTGPVLALLQRRLDQVASLTSTATDRQQLMLDRIEAVSERTPTVRELAAELRHQLFDGPRLAEERRQAQREMMAHIDQAVAFHGAPIRAESIEKLVRCPQPLKSVVSRLHPEADPIRREVMLEVLTRRYYRVRELEGFHVRTSGGFPVVTASYLPPREETPIALVTTMMLHSRLAKGFRNILPKIKGAPEGHEVAVDVYAWMDEPVDDHDALRDEVLGILEAAKLPETVRRVTVATSTPDAHPSAAGDAQLTFRRHDGAFAEDRVHRGIHPMLGKRLELWRLENFDLERLPSVEDVYLFHGKGKENPSDERLFAVTEVGDLTPVRDADGRVVELPHLERKYLAALAAIREFQRRRPARQRLYWNRLFLHVRPPFEFPVADLEALVARLEPPSRGLGLEKILISGRIPDAETGEVVPRFMQLTNPTGHGAVVQFRVPSDRPLQPLSPYAQKVVRLRSRGLVYPYELIDILTPAREGVRSDFPPGEFQELDLDDSGERLVPVDRPRGENVANVVVGLLTSFTEKYPEGMKRVAILGDPSRSMGSLAEAECRRILAALDLAEEEEIPLEWYAISAGARIALDTGVENMDWIALVLKRLITFTQAGHEVNVVVAGINVGAQPYWNAEATMLMHTRGVLIMTPQSTMVLTGKRALDFSGGISAEDDLGIGGYDRVMGPNGQAQYFASTLDEACKILLRYYGHSYRLPRERFPRRAETADPVDRDVCESEHGVSAGCNFETVGDVFSDETNPDRKKPFDIRKVMAACVDRDHPPLERWFGWRDAEIAVVWDAHLGGHPVCVLGLESKPIPRLGHVPADGPEIWTGGTLFPNSSKKVARAINSVAGRRPLVVLANLSGFDGSPDSLRRWQLEFGAEIGRAVVNFQGPIVFIVVSRYHGGAFVVFSNQLNDRMEVAALEGTYASVIGGAPAAGVVFAREIKKRTQQDPRVKELEESLAAAQGADRVRLRLELNEVQRVVHSEKLGEMATEYDGIHDVHRAREMGSIHRILPPEQLRPYLVEAVERGIERSLSDPRP